MGRGAGAVVAAVPAGEAAAVPRCGRSAGRRDSLLLPAGVKSLPGLRGWGSAAAPGPRPALPPPLCKRSRGRGAGAGPPSRAAARARSAVNVQRGRHMPSSELSSTASRGCLPGTGNASTGSAGAV